MPKVNLLLKIEGEDPQNIKAATAELAIFGALLQSRFNLLVDVETPPIDTQSQSDEESSETEICRGRDVKETLVRHVTFAEPLNHYDPDLYAPNGTYTPIRR